MTKAKIWKLTILIVSLTIIGVLVAGIVTLALIKFDLNPKIDLANAQGAKVYQASSTYSKELAYGSENYNKIVDAFENSFKTSYLNAMTNKYTKERYEISTCSQTLSSLESENAFSVLINFSPLSTAKYLKNADDTYYKISNTQIRYYAVLIVIPQIKDKFENVEIYFSTNVTLTNANYKLSTHANFYDLAKVLEEICA